MRSEIIANFQKQVYEYYEAYGRYELPWRQPDLIGAFDPYKIMVSELMLQQTQVIRVIPKYQSFLATFPSVEALAFAPLSEVLNAWSGLGYNRRAKYLHQAARFIAGDCGGQFPRSVKLLTLLPGVGPNTAGAILVYAFNQPEVFIETNIRSVFIHHFFTEQQAIPDKDILQLVEKTMDRNNPRLWYWALMDYGSFLKQTIGNPNKASKSYAKQSAFQGSRRQIRGAVIRLLGEKGPLKFHAMNKQIPDQRLAEVLTELTKEGLIRNQAGRYLL